VSGGVPWAFTFAALSFDVLALGSLRLRVFRHVGVGFPPPPRLSTAWRWGWVASASASFDTLALGPSASASFDTLALGCPRLRVFRHLGIGPPPPPRLSTPWRWVASASASFDTLALGPLRLRVFRRLGVGFPSPPSLGGCLPPCLVCGGLAAPSCGSCGHRKSGAQRLDSQCRSVVRLVVVGDVSAVSPMGGLVDLAWVCRGGRGILTG
jgi:hypothetical protein